MASTPQEIRRKLTHRLALLDADRERYRAHWVDIRDFLLPHHSIGLTGRASGAKDQIDGGKKRSKILDHAPEHALHVLASGMQSGLTSPSRPWFRLALADKALMEQSDVKLWLEICEEQLRYVFSKSNLYRSFHQGYIELGAFGTWAQLIDEDFHTGINCRSFTIGEYWIGLNARLQVDVFYRSFWMTAYQLIEEYGLDNVSTKVKNAYETGNLTTLFEVVQAIEPNDDRLDLNDLSEKPYRSVTFEAGGDDDRLLRVKGYEDFPVQAPRWSTVGAKTYGDSLAMANLGDIKMLQKIVEKQLVNLDKAMNPPLKAPSSLKNDVVNVVPGGITFSDDMAGRDNLSPLYQVPNLIEQAEAKLNAVKLQISKGFYNDLFLMLANLDRRNMTATEVAERHEEKLLMLGPVLERLNNELLDPTVTRTFNVLLRTGMLPPPPPALQGQDIHIEYISILAQAQKLVGVTNVQQFAGFVGSLGAVHPEVFDNVNFDALVEDYADRVGVSPKIMRPPELVAQMRQAKAQQAAMQQQAAIAQQLAQGAKTLSDTSVDPNNALGMLMGRMPGMAPAPN